MHEFEPEWQMMRRTMWYTLPFLGGLLLGALVLAQAGAFTKSNEMQATDKYAAAARKE